MISRKAFLKNSGLALFAAGIGGVPTFIARAAGMQKIDTPYKKKKILVFRSISVPRFRSALKVMNSGWNKY